MKRIIISVLVLAICFAAVPMFSISAESTPESTGIRSVYKPQTGIVNAPSVVQTIDTNAKLKALSNTVTPQGAWFYISGSSHKAVTNEGEHALSEIFAACKNRVIPYLELPNKAAADAVTSYIKTNGITDVIFVSDNSDVVKYVSDMKIGYSRLALISGITDNSALMHAAHKCNANIVVVKSADRARAEYMQKHFLSVTVNPSKSDEGSVRAAVDCGANGVVVKDIARPYEMYAQITEETYVRRAFTVAHRGRNTVAPENTVESLKEAINVGSDAIECDVYLTSDGEIVVNHNGNISGYTTNTSANGNIEGFTRAQLKEYTLKTVGSYSGCKFAFLDEFFTVLKDSPNVNLVIEIKSSNTKVPQKIYDLAKKMDMLDQIVIISFSASQLKLSRSVMPEIGASLLGYYSADALSATKTIMSSICADSMDISPEISIGTETIYALSQRGITVNVWTLGSYTDMIAQAKRGATFLTTNAANAANSVNKAFGAMSAEKMWGEYTEPVVVLYGDADDNGTVNLKDMLIIKKYTVGITKEINETNSDVNFDGKCNLKDMLMIKKHLVGVKLKPWDNV